MSKKAAEHHHKAAEHHEHAARHHKEAAKHHEAGKFETAAHHAHLASGHQQHARHYAAEAAKAHIEDHEKALPAKAYFDRRSSAPPVIFSLLRPANNRPLPLLP